MRICDIGHVSEMEGVDSHRFFQRDHRTVSKVEFLLAHTAIKADRGLEFADRLLFDVVEEVRFNVFAGSVCDCELACYELPSRPMLLSEFLDQLQPLVISERQAIVFALATGHTLENMVHMTRLEAFSTQWEPFPARLLAAVVPHIRCKYMFWKLEHNFEAVPLLDLESKWESLSGKNWTDFQKSFGEMVIYMPPDSEELGAFMV